MTTSRVIVRIAVVLGAAGLPLLTNGCGAGAPAGEKATESSEALAKPSCADQPFTQAMLDDVSCTGGGGTSGGGGGVKLQACVRSWSCQLVTDDPAYPRGSAYSEMNALTGYATGALVVAPAGPSGCTAGAVLRPNYPNVTATDSLGDGTVYVDMWACPVGTPLPTKSVDGVAMCLYDPLTYSPPNSYVPTGQTECAWFYEGQHLQSGGGGAGTDCAGNASGDITLLQQRVFVQTWDHGHIGLACEPGGCDIPQ